MSAAKEMTVTRIEAVFKERIRSLKHAYTEEFIEEAWAKLSPEIEEMFRPKGGKFKDGYGCNKGPFAKVLAWATKTLIPTFHESGDERINLVLNLNKVIHDYYNNGYLNHAGFLYPTLDEIPNEVAFIRDIANSEHGEHSEMFGTVELNRAMNSALRVLCGAQGEGESRDDSALYAFSLSKNYKKADKDASDFCFAEEEDEEGEEDDEFSGFMPSEKRARMSDWVM